MDSKHTDTERRQKKRFQIERELRWKIIGDKPASGTGKTIDMSSGGILFRANRELQSGQMANLLIDWPLSWIDGKKVQLEVNGMIRRTQGRKAAIAISSYVFLRVDPPVPIER